MRDAAARWNVSKNYIIWFCAKQFLFRESPLTWTGKKGVARHERILKYLKFKPIFAEKHLQKILWIYARNNKTLCAVNTFGNFTTQLDLLLVSFRKFVACVVLHKLGTEDNFADCWHCKTRWPIWQLMQFLSHSCDSLRQRHVHWC